MFDFSSFSPRARQQYLNALKRCVEVRKGCLGEGEMYGLEVTDFTDESACSDDGEADPEAPHDTT